MIFKLLLLTFTHSIYFVFTILLFSCSRLKRTVHPGCYSKVGLPLIENSSIVEQPLNLWTLTERYKSAALGIINNARYDTTAKKKITFSHLC